MVLKVLKYLRTTISSWLLLLLFIEYVGGMTLFMHSHVINGEQIFHSHIYNGSAEQPNHSHSQQQVKVIAALSTFFVVAACTPLFISAPIGTRITYLRTTTQNIIQQCSHNLHLRAPPVVM